MADAYWRYGDNRQQAAAAAAAAAAAVQPPLAAKRPRTEFDAPSGQELPGYYVRDDDRSARVIRDTDSINASYDQYLRSAQMPPYGGGETARPVSGGRGGYSVDDPYITGMGRPDPAMGIKSRTMAVGGGRPEVSLPPDASSTLFVEGLPANCTRREVSHIFRPFVGYKEVRLVTKESRHPGGDPLVLCFVDFVSPAHAATAMDALQEWGSVQRNDTNTVLCGLNWSLVHDLAIIQCYMRSLIVYEGSDCIYTPPEWNWGPTSKNVH